MLSRFFLGALVFASVCSSSVSANVVIAGDFENAPRAYDNWYMKHATVDTDAAAAHSGSNSIKSAFPSEEAGALARIQQYLTVPSACPDGSVPSLSFWYRTEGNGVTGAVHVYQGFEEVGGPLVNTEVHENLSSQAAYTLASTSLGVFAGHKIGINVEFLGADESAAFYADDFSIC